MQELNQIEVELVSGGEVIQTAERSATERALGKLGDWVYGIFHWSDRLIKIKTTFLHRIQTKNQT